MHLAYAFLASAAEINENKFSVLGGDFDTIYLQSFPAELPDINLIVKFLAQPEDVGDHHEVEIRATHDGELVAKPVTVALTVPGNERRPGKQSGVSLLTHMRLKAERPSEIRISVLLDDNELTFLPLYIEQLDPATDNEAEGGD